MTWTVLVLLLMPLVWLAAFSIAYSLTNWWDDRMDERRRRRSEAFDNFHRGSP